ncbi:exocyst complex component Sec5-domain-containing protein [Stachybotrys elegans]|uniref:Exocyst complex component SEC5 n=1 Tax=Stachybotrys elegans TaxID=80388 RepID=A0A8K0SXP1_9HYPO|nr:exocyst complex component Sec5-domain-containing protein [Stachybotrys elegans]
MTSDYERTVLDFYQLPTPYPTEWPAEKDDDDLSDDEVQSSRAQLRQDRKSRYQALEKAISDRRSVLGSERGKGGVGTLVQKDEPDPLGSSDSVVRVLKLLNLPVQDDTRLRNRFLLSSTTFSPALFLSQVHAADDTQSLLNGLEVLSRSIDQKSASLKVLVETNFERFVKAKATIDNVYKEMKYRGTEPQSMRARSHSRHASRSSFRNSISAPQNFNAALVSPVADTRKKNALVKESEYGVMGIKAPLLDVSAKAEDVWGPALGGQEKEENLKVVSTYIDRFKEQVELSSSLAESIKRKDYETLVEEYNRARRFADETRKIAADLGGSTPGDVQLYQMLLAGRIWHDIDQQIQTFKREMWKKLVTTHPLPKSQAMSVRPQDDHLEIISSLLELGVDDSPIWVWLLSRYDHLKGKIQSFSDRSKVEIEVLRRRLANTDRPSPETLASHLRTLGRQNLEGKHSATDTPDVIELWEKILAFLTNLLSSQGILGELVDFWQIAQGFIDGNTQKSLPIGYNGESRVHHQLPAQAVSELQKGIVELVDLIREHVYIFFAALPPEDVSLLFSPLPMTPSTPATATTPRDPRFNFDSNTAPQSPVRGETWEKIAFWPPWSNSISGVHYLTKMMTLVGTGACDMASIDPVASGDGQIRERLKSLVTSARERCVFSLCGAWNKDAENIKYVEDWQRSLESGDVTKMPTTFSTFEGILLSGMQKILYISEAMSKPGAGDIVQPPPNKLLQMVRSQYVTTLYKALSGMVENAERPTKKAENDWLAVTADTAAAAAAATTVLAGKGTLDASDRNIRMLVTLSNLQALRSQVVPSLNSQFENAFSVKLTEESKTIKDVLGQIDARLFQSYTKQSIEKLRTIVQAGISASDWEPSASQRPQAAKPYVYEALLTLVLVHSQVSTTAPSLTSQVLSFLFEQTSVQLLEAFRLRPKYPLEALMQATLDVEFIAQTLTHYTTQRASELQGQIYQELDSRTDNDARTRLQNELPEMRSVLKKLREASKTEFACFRKPKRPGYTASRTNSGMSS